MSERYNVAASAVLGENYKITNIECSDYNPSIDGNITVTITVTDVYEDPVTGESVTVTASEGTFTQLNGSDITSASSVTGTTNSSGQFTLTYTCTELGLITFTANNKTTQISVNGWKQVATTTVSGVTYTCSVNGEGLARVRATATNVSFATGNSHEASDWIPTDYKPSTDKVVWTQRALTSNIGVYLFSNGSAGVANTYSSTQTRSLATDIIYSYG